jgi:lipopolysaccharide/colanic/teichoic acid biosynthesis glycosyltransferase
MVTKRIQLISAGYGDPMLAETEQSPMVRMPSNAGGVSLAERAVACLALAVAALPAIATAALIRGLLGSPVMFRQIRSGVARRPFTVVKFRTMRESRDAEGILLPDEQRETAATRLVRRLRLDEIPQLLAIVRGEMRFVGPRPLKAETIEAFGALGELRASVPPGLTGWAQVNGNTRLTNAEKLALDIWYVDHRSFRLDAHIAWLTVATILFGERVGPGALAQAQEHLDRRAAASQAAMRGAGS